MGWRVARSLDTLLSEVNVAAPNRSKAADGSIGDTSHSARASDHNPNPAGVVRARDFTDDPASGCDSSDLAERVRLLGVRGHPALGPGAYVISDGRIASATYGWAWRPYAGSNPHNHHCHVSVATSAAGYDSTEPWFTTEDDMAAYDERLRSIEEKVDLIGSGIVKLAKAEQQRDRASWRREAALAKEIKRLGGDVDKVLAEVQDEP